MYIKAVNEMLGDIVKVTPSSKAVGDMAIFMVQNDLTPENIYEKAKGMDFPDSIVSYFEGMMGQPEGGFPKELQELVLKGRKPITCRPGELLPDEDFDAIKEYLKNKYDFEPTDKDAISYALYPKVFEDYLTLLKKEGSFRYMDSDIFFHGIMEGSIGEVEISEGKILVIKLVEIKNPDEDGNRELIFQVNGLMRQITINDKAAVTKASKQMVVTADPDDEHEIGANIPGNIVKILVKEGEEVKAGQPIAVIEAMKMETNIISAIDGVIDKIYVNQGDQVISGQLIAKLEEDEVDEGEKNVTL